MEERKQKEIEYYDKKTKGFSEQKFSEKKQGDFEGFNPLILASYKFFYKLLKKNCRDKIILDYGCGNGIHSIFPLRSGAKKLIGIDLSEESLKIAKKRAEQKGLQEKIEFLKMDCETMEFDDNFFDVILDGGTFSSLDMNKAFPELARILKPDGFLIGIETFGHNPITNLKRKLNEITNKRTKWAAEHIMKNKNLKIAEKYFGKTDIYFFHLISWAIFPFLSLPGSKFLLKILEKIDSLLLKLPFFKKYSFKIVFIFSQPRK